MQLCRDCFNRERHGATPIKADLDVPVKGDCDNRTVGCDNEAQYEIMIFVDGYWRYQ